MKYNVLGFYQPRAVELNLSSDDLLVLRWFVDYAGTNKMRSMIIDNQIFYWVNYAKVLEELPILKISKQTLYKRNFTNLCNANVLIHKQIKDGGNFSYYCYGINYDTLIYLQTDDPCVKNNNLVSKSTEPYVENYQTLVSKSTEQINNISKINNKSNDNIYSQVCDYLNEKIGSKYKSTTPKTQQLIKTREKEGFSLDDFKKVIDNMVSRWKGSEMEQYLRPETLFGTKFESYLNAQPIKSKTNDFATHNYSEEQLNSVFDSLDDVEI